MTARWTTKVLAVALALAPLAASRPARADSTVHDVSNTANRPEGEEAVAVNPANPANVLVGSNQFGAGGSLSDPPRCALWASFDGGDTWAPGGIAIPGADQSVVFDRHGVAYFECETVVTGGLGVVVSRSIDGGRHWSAPVTAATPLDSQGHQIDRPFLAIDDSGGRRDGTLYLGWESMFTEPVAAVFVRSSTDGGRTFGPVERVDTAGHPALWDPRQSLTVGADGAVYSVYASSLLASPLLPQLLPAAFPFAFVVGRSTDGGRTFQLSVVDGHVVRAQSAYEADESFAELIAAIAADPRRGGRLAVAWPDKRSGEARILVSVSSDGARSWTPVADIADDPPGRGDQHDHVALAFLPDGRLVVVWRDRRSSGGAWTDPFQVWARPVTVGSASLAPGPSVELTTGPQPPATPFKSGGSLSEYLAATAGPEGLSASWDEMRGAFADNVFRRLPLSALAAPGAVPPPPPTASPSTAPAPPAAGPAPAPGTALPATGGSMPVTLAAVLVATGLAGAVLRRRSSPRRR